MRILGLTNFLPPLNYGYGAICADAMSELASRGHRVDMLAADGGEALPFAVRRELAHRVGADRAVAVVQRRQEVRQPEDAHPRYGPRTRPARKAGATRARNA